MRAKPPRNRTRDTAARSRKASRKRLRSTAASSQTPALTSVRSVALPSLTSWHERPLLPLKVASEIIGVSVASLYNFVDQGRLRFRQLGGRTLVDTKSLMALVDNAEEWTPSDRGKEARAKRKQLARAALR